MWFAAGAVATSVTWIVAQEFIVSNKPMPLILVRDRDRIDPTLIQGSSNEEIAIQMSSAGFVRKCGATSFVSNWNGGSHTAPETAVDVESDNTDTLNCILANAPKEGFSVTVSFEAK